MLHTYQKDFLGANSQYLRTRKAKTGFMKISGKMYKFLTDTLANMSQNIFAYFSISEHSASFYLFQKKHRFWLWPGGLPPPPRLRTAP